jgi:hypothetical protein
MRRFTPQDFLVSAEKLLRKIRFSHLWEKFALRHTSPADLRSYSGKSLSYDKAPAGKQSANRTALFLLYETNHTISALRLATMYA